ncbi:MAG: hypothetical protein EAZ99_04015 [Alphaproteobacteria bacterium]|nr:MAG: hypothetical protein EAZ99_04015 [Alphaproteobacteria bacterium]
MKFTAHGRLFQVPVPTGEHLASAFDIAGSKAANPIRLGLATFAAAGGTIDGVRLLYEDLLKLPATVASVLSVWANGGLTTIGIVVEDDDPGPLAPGLTPAA